MIYKCCLIFAQSDLFGEIHPRKMSIMERGIVESLIGKNNIKSGDILTAGNITDKQFFNGFTLLIFVTLSK